MPYDATSGRRLREERDRVGLTQQGLAELLGTRREIVSRYENGSVVPGGEILEGLCRAGVDIAYVLTGQRESGNVLSMEERLLLDYYRAASAEVKKSALVGLIGASSASGTPGKVDVVVHGDVGQSVHGGRQKNVKISVGGARSPRRKSDGEQ